MDSTTGKKIKIILLLILFVFPLDGLSAQYVELDELLKDPQFSLEWNSLTSSGQLLHKNTKISFKVGTDFLIVDFKRKVNTQPILKKNNRLLFHTETVALILKLISELEQEKQLTGRVAVIILDAGHGGKDPGAVGTHTVNKEKLVIYEKNVVLNVALKLEALLTNRFPEKRIILTRKDDLFHNLEKRSQIANDVSPDNHDAILFISLHTNSGFNPGAQGFEVWHLPSDYRRTVLDAKKTDLADAEILPILNTMLEEEYLIESIKLANSISKNLEKQVGMLTLNRGLKEEAWSVVRKSNMPSILIELGFVSNREEAMRLNDDNYLNKLALGIYNGIIDFTTTFESVKGFRD